MANKISKQTTVQKQKEIAFQLATRNLKWLLFGGVVLCIVALITFLMNWSSIYNTTISGNEVSVNGFQYFLAGLTGDYKNPSYGDIAVPFYYYAKDTVELLSIFTVISFICLIVTIISACIVVATKKHALSVISAVGALFTGIFLCVCFGIALSMSSSKILSVYCGGNPACSIRSLAIVPAIFCLVSGVIFAVSAIKYYFAKTDLQ